jgi:hypothetical protein
MAYNDRGHAGDLDDNTAQESAKAAPDADAAGTPIAARDPGDANRDRERSADSGSGGAEPGVASRSSRAGPFPDTQSDTDWLYWDDRYRRRRRFSLLARVWSWFGGGTSESRGRTAAELREIAREAYTLHREFAHQSTAHVAAHCGYAELSGLSANEQVAFMKEHWREAGAREAQDLANGGELAIAGLERSGGTGHTAVVTPGEGATKPDGNFYPSVTGGGPASARSDGSKTAADVWPARDWRAVRYYTPA